MKSREYRQGWEDGFEAGYHRAARDLLLTDRCREAMEEEYELEVRQTKLESLEKLKQGATYGKVCEGCQRPLAPTTSGLRCVFCDGINLNSYFGKYAEDIKQDLATKREQLDNFHRVAEGKNPESDDGGRPVAVDPTGAQDSTAALNATLDTESRYPVRCEEVATFGGAEVRCVLLKGHLGAHQTDQDSSILQWGTWGARCSKCGMNGRPGGRTPVTVRADGLPYCPICWHQTTKELCLEVAVFGDGLTIPCQLPKRHTGPHRTTHPSNQGAPFHWGTGRDSRCSRCNKLTNSGVIAAGSGLRYCESCWKHTMLADSKELGRHKKGK